MAAQSDPFMELFSDLTSLQSLHNDINEKSSYKAPKNTIKAFIPAGCGAMKLSEISDGVITCEGVTGYPTVIANCKLTSGKWYYEIRLNEARCGQMGWGTHNQQILSSDGLGTGDTNKGWAYDGHRSLKWNGTKVAYGKKWKQNDIIGCCLDLDDKEMRFHLNGQNMGPAFNNFNIYNGITPSCTIQAGGKFTMILNENKWKYFVYGYNAIPFRAITCPQDHKLEEHVSTTVICDSCYDKSTDNVYHSCRQCDFDLCYNCSIQKQSLTQQPQDDIKDATATDDDDYDDGDSDDMDNYISRIMNKHAHANDDNDLGTDLSFQLQNEEIKELKSKNEILMKHKTQLIANKKKNEIIIKKQKNIINNLKNDIKNYKIKNQELNKQNSQLKMNDNLIKKQKKTILLLNDDFKELELNYKQLKVKYNSQKLKLGYSSWDYNDIVEWIINIDIKFKKYKNILIKNMKDEEIDGSCLSDLSENDLYRMGVKPFKDKKLIFNHLQQLIKNTTSNNGNDNDNANDNDNNVAAPVTANTYQDEGATITYQDHK